MSEIDHQITVNDRQQRIGLWSAGIFAAVMAALFGAIIYAVFVGQKGKFQLEDLVLLPATALLFCASLLGFFLIRRGKYKLGTEILFVTNMLLPIIGTILLDNILWVSIAYILIFAPIMYNWILLKSSRRFALVILGVVILVMIGIEVWSPSFRGSIEFVGNAVWVIIILATAIMLISLLRQAWIAGRVSFGLRLTLLTTMIAIPVIVVALFLMVSQATNIIEIQSTAQLQKTNQTISGNVAIWARQQVQTLATMVTMPDIISMDADSQTPVLVTFGNGHPQIYLAHTMDTTGMNIARNDGKDLNDYQDRGYFVGPASGEPVVFQSLISRTTGQPAVCMGSPIQGQAGNLVGVGSICSELVEISQGVQITQIGETGFTYVVDEKNQVIAHPDSTFTTELSDFSEYPPVAMLRDGEKGLVTFIDNEGQEWYAYIDELENGWGVIAQQNSAELSETLVGFQIAGIVVTIVGVIILAVAVWLVVQQAVRPVGELTRTAEAIATGDLNQTTPEDREDEFGVLARAFNSMTAQLRELVGSLEQRIAERTQALETSTQVGRRLSTILDQRDLVREVVEQVQSAFGYYHAHIYLFDEQKENLVMTGGTGEAGRTMLASGHSVPTGRGLVGRAGDTNLPVLVSDVSQAEGWLPNPLLPETKAEVAIPIAAGETVLGVLDVQDNEVGGLTEADVDLLQSIANQVASALQNARAYQQTQQQVAREALITSINQQIQSTTDVKEALQVAVRELGRALDADTSVRLVSEPNGDEK